MEDWKELYLTLMRETERAIRILTEAQRKCEELYLQEPAATVPSAYENASTETQAATTANRQDACRVS